MQLFAWVKRVRAQGKTYEYLQVVESVRTGGKVRQRLVCNLARVDQLPEGRGEELIGALTRVARQPWFSLQEVREGLRTPSAQVWGPVLVAERLWKEAELDRALRRGRAGQARNLTFVRKSQRGQEQGWWERPSRILRSRRRRAVHLLSRRAPSQLRKHDASGVAGLQPLQHHEGEEPPLLGV